MTDGPGWASPDQPDPQRQPPAGQPTQPPPPNWSAPGRDGPKPGVIPLRPLGVSEILDGAISTMRAHPKPMLGVSAVVVTISQVLVLAATYPLLDDLNRLASVTETTPPDEIFAGLGATLGVLGVTLLITLLARVFLSGFITMVVGKAVLGQPVGFAEVWFRVRPRLLPLLGLTLVYPAIAIGAILLVFLLAVTVPALAVVVGLAMIPIGVWLYILFSLATPALMLEDAGVGRAFGRSRQLVRGSWWRIFGISLLATIIAIIIALIIGVPFEYFGGGFDSTVPVSATYLVLSAIGGIIAGTITEPFVVAAMVLLYTDQRMRREGMDIELARMAGLNP